MANLGPASARVLEAAGIRSRADLERLGAARAFVAVKLTGARPSLNLLYALEGALTGAHWSRLAPERRSALLLEVDARLDAHRAAARRQGARR